MSFYTGYPSFENFKNTFDSAITVVMDWFKDRYLMGDEKRVIISSTAMALRKRASGNQWSNANLPFANVFIKSIEKKVDRPWYNHLLATDGIWIPELNRKVKMLPVRINFEASLFYHNTYDLQFSTFRLMQDEHFEDRLTIPMLNEQNMEFPLFGVIDYNLNTENTFSEKEFLERNNIKVVTVDPFVDTWIIWDTPVYPTERILARIANLGTDFEYANIVLPEPPPPPPPPVPSVAGRYRVRAQFIDPDFVQYFPYIEEGSRWSFGGNDYYRVGDLNTIFDPESGNTFLEWDVESGSSGSDFSLSVGTVLTPYLWDYEFSLAFLPAQVYSVVTVASGPSIVRTAAQVTIAITYIDNSDDPWTGNVILPNRFGSPYLWWTDPLSGVVFNQKVSVLLTKDPDAAIWTGVVGAVMAYEPGEASNLSIGTVLSASNPYSASPPDPDISVTAIITSIDVTGVG